MAEQSESIRNLLKLEKLKPLAQVQKRNSCITLGFKDQDIARVPQKPKDRS